MTTRTTSTSVSGEIQFYQTIEPRHEDEKMAITACVSGVNSETGVHYMSPWNTSKDLVFDQKDFNNSLAES